MVHSLGWVCYYYYYEYYEYYYRKYNTSITTTIFQALVYC